MVNLHPGATCKVCAGPVPPRSQRRHRTLKPRRICLDPDCFTQHRSAALEAAHAKTRAASAALGHERAETCAICFGPMPPRARITRVTCGKPECLAAANAYSVRIAANARRRKRAATPPPAKRTCCGCKRQLPYNPGNFVRIGNGKLGGRCRTCEAKRQRRLYRQQKARQRLYEKTYGARFVAAAPLVTAIQRDIDRHLGDSGTVFERAGINDSPTKPDSRRFREWRAGRAPSVRPELADRVITGLDLLWIDVWNPDARTSDDTFSSRRPIDVLKWIDAAWDAQYVFEGQ